MTLDNILEEIKKAETIVVLCHESPDGDAVASSLSVMHAVAKLGKEADVIIPEYSKVFDFLPGADKILQKGRTNKYDLAISVDCSDLKRLVGGKEYFETAKRTIEIDHHSVNSMFADFNYVDPVAPACCQVLIGMFEYFGIDIDKELGTCLLTGIITDTGGFQYSSVTSDTFEFAAQLLRKGVNISKICQEVLKTKTKAHCQLEKLIYERLEFIENGKIAITYLTLKDYAEYSNDMGDDEGLVESIRDIEGVEVAVLLKEKENGGFKISMRSKDNVNVSDICLLLGGGGHPRAAGCFITGDVSQAKTKVINTIKQQINNEEKIVDGIVIINKPKHQTSHDIVRKAKKILNEKVGHTGTLDPNATGVLPLLIGKGTELSKYLINHDKTYEAILQLGEKRDTGDVEGKIIEQKNVTEKSLNTENINSVFKTLIGKQEQIPPIYSALKVNGKKLYEYARNGENVKIEPRQIEIYSLELLNVDNINKTIHFKVECSKGTYIRTLCEGIAERLGTVGYMKELNRTRVGDFYIENSITIEQLEQSQYQIITIEQFFKDEEFINLTEKGLKLFLNGVQLTYHLVDGIYRIYQDDKFIGIGTIKNELLKRDIII